MRWYAFALISAFILFLQCTWLDALAVGNGKADLALAFAVLIALWGKDTQAIVAAWLLGLGKDFVSGVPLGSHALAYYLICLAVTFLREQVFTEGPIPAAVAAFFAALSAQLILVILLRILFHLPSLPLGAGEILISACFTALIAVSLWYLLHEGPRRWLRLSMDRDHGDV